MVNVEGKDGGFDSLEARYLTVFCAVLGRGTEAEPEEGVRRKDEPHPA